MHNRNKPSMNGKEEEKHFFFVSEIFGDTLKKSSKTLSKESKRQMTVISSWMHDGMRSTQYLEVFSPRGWDLCAASGIGNIQIWDYCHLS